MESQQAAFERFNRQAAAGRSKAPESYRKHSHEGRGADRSSGVDGPLPDLYSIHKGKVVRVEGELDLKDTQDDHTWTSLLNTCYRFWCFRPDPRLQEAWTRPQDTGKQAFLGAHFGHGGCRGLCVGKNNNQQEAQKFGCCLM